MNHSDDDGDCHEDDKSDIWMIVIDGRKDQDTHF